MKLNKILVTGFDRSDLDQNIWSRIKKNTGQIVFSPETGVDCLFSRFNKVDRKLIDSLPGLKYIGLLATGTGTVDLDYAKRKKIVVSNIPGYSTESVAEFTFSVILDYLRELEKAKKQTREGNYSESAFKATEIKNKKFGIIGLGKIGGRVAEIAQGFGADVYYWSRNRKKEYEKKGVKYQKIDELISQSDFLSLHLSLTSETRNFLDRKRIRKIKKGAVVLNLAPMELVDIKAVSDRLKRGEMTFILDHSDEMSKIDLEKLSKYKNCIIYPPIAYISEEAKAAKQEIFISNIENFLEGKPQNKVN